VAINAVSDLCFRKVNVYIHVECCIEINKTPALVYRDTIWDL
jgi:hypothetical protein